MTRVALIALADGSYSVEDAAQSLTLARIVPTGNRCWLVISTPPTISVGGRFGGPYDAFMAVQAQVEWRRCLS